MTEKSEFCNSSADKELQIMANTEEDITFKQFRKRISHSPLQVVRYDRLGQPLWISSHGQVDEVPPCSNCGSPRIFECQILPQMLNYLQIDQLGNSIDWGTLAIYSCRDSCQNGPSYKEEVVIKQDITK